MSHTDNPAGTALNHREMHTILPCGGNFSLERVEGLSTTGETMEFVFDPPYQMRNGEDYALYQTQTGQIELWQVECIDRGNWRWVQEAKRARTKRKLSLVAVNGNTLS